MVALRPTRKDIETELVDAFRALPSTPIFGSAAAVRLTGDRTSPATRALAWLELVVDRHDRLVLASWARCRAERESFGELCKAMGWSRSSAEDGRRRTAEAIAEILAARPVGT